MEQNTLGFLQSLHMALQFLPYHREGFLKLHFDKRKAENLPESSMAYRLPMGKKAKEQEKVN
jgi:hypothetical protein